MMQTAQQVLHSSQEMAIDDARAIFLIGSNIRHEAPILGQRVRKAWRAGAQIAALNPVDWNFHFSLANQLITAPQNMVSALASVAKAVSAKTAKALPEAFSAAVAGEADESHAAIAEMLCGEGPAMLVLGQAALAHAQASWLRQLSAWIADASGASLNILTHGANATGASLGAAQPVAGEGLNARDMLTNPLKAYLLWDVEPDHDFANPALAMAALGSADTVVAVSSFANEALKATADIILPLAPLAESEGTFYTFDGQSRSVESAVKPNGDCRPGWKILRRLGENLELDGFAQVDLKGLREEMLAEIGFSDQVKGDVTLTAPETAGDLYRVGELAMYSVDGLCRRSDHLQKTAHAQTAFVGLNPNDAGSRGFLDGVEVKVSQGGNHINLPVRICQELPVGAVWVKTATPSGRELGDSFGPISVEAS